MRPTVAGRPTHHLQPTGSDQGFQGAGQEQAAPGVSSGPVASSVLVCKAARQLPSSGTASLPWVRNFTQPPSV